MLTNTVQYNTIFQSKAFTRKNSKKSQVRIKGNFRAKIKLVNTCLANLSYFASKTYINNRRYVWGTVPNTIGWRPSDEKFRWISITLGETQQNRSMSILMATQSLIKWRKNGLIWWLIAFINILSKAKLRVHTRRRLFHWWTDERTRQRAECFYCIRVFRNPDETRSPSLWNGFSEGSNWLAINTKAKKIMLIFSFCFLLFH